MSVLFDVGVFLAGMGIFIWASSKCYFHFSAGALLNKIREFIENLPEEATKLFTHLSGGQYIEVPKDDQAKYTGKEEDL